MAGRTLQQPQNRTFDDAKLAVMIEPLTIRIDKKKGSTRMPIPMPVSDDGRPPGTGLSKEDLRVLEQWLVNDWAGGGYYEIAVTDSSTPTPLTMKWEPFWNPAEYPEKMPPTLAEAAAIAATQRPQTVAAPIPQPQVPRMSTTPAFPGGFPPGLPQPAAQAPQPQSFYGQPYPFYSQAPYGGFGGGGNAYNAQSAQADAERRRYDEERRMREERDFEKRKNEEVIAKMQTELQAAKEASVRAQYEQELARERAKADERVKGVEAQMNELRTMMSNMATSIQTGVTKNPEIEALREQTRLQAERIEREQREREAERREREMRDMMKAQFEATQKQIETMQRQFETAQARLAAEAANSNRGPDPLIMMMQEQNRLQVESLKEMQRNSAAQMQQMQSFMMKPQDMLLLTKESQGTIDQTAERLTRHYGSVMELQTKVMEQALSLQPQGGGAAEMVRDGMAGVKDLAERYIGSQQAKAAVQAQVQTEQTKAQLRAMEIEHAARAPQPQVVYAPPPPRVEGQLAGPSVGTNGKPRKKPRQDNKGITPPVEGDPTKRFGKSDLEWFGPLLVEVMQLREGVTRYIESLAAQPPRLNKDGEPDGISVEQAAMGIAQAMTIVMQQGIPIPAMVDLLNQQRYADFMDVLLPAAPQAYRDDVVQETIKQLKTIGIDKPAKPGVALSIVPDSDDDEDDDDDDDEPQAAAAAPDAGDPDNDDDNDGKPVAPPPSNGRKRPAARA